MGAFYASGVTMGLAVQPSAFRDIAAMPGLRNRGLLARTLYSLPTNTGARIEDYYQHQVSQHST